MVAVRALRLVLTRAQVMLSRRRRACAPVACEGVRRPRLTVLPHSAHLRTLEHWYGTIVFFNTGTQVHAPHTGWPPARLATALCAHALSPPSITFPETWADIRVGRARNVGGTARVKPASIGWIRESYPPTRLTGVNTRRMSNAPPTRTGWNASAPPTPGRTDTGPDGCGESQIPAHLRTYCVVASTPAVMCPMCGAAKAPCQLL